MLACIAKHATLPGSALFTGHGLRINTQGLAPDCILHGAEEAFHGMAILISINTPRNMHVCLDLAPNCVVWCLQGQTHKPNRFDRRFA